MDVIKTWEQWATSYQQETHREALQLFGEKVLLRKVWTPQDYEKGLVSRCESCHGGTTGDINTRLSNVYQQGGATQCAECFGVGYEGGFQPAVYATHMMVDDAPEERQNVKSGQWIRTNYRVQFPFVPRLTSGDLVVRVVSWLDETTPEEESARFTTSNVDYQALRSGPRLGVEQDMIIGQTATIYRLPLEHEYYKVPVT